MSNNLCREDISAVVRDLDKILVNLGDWKKRPAEEAVLCDRLFISRMTVQSVVDAIDRKIS